MNKNTTVVYSWKITPMINYCIFAYNTQTETLKWVFTYKTTFFLLIRYLLIYIQDRMRFSKLYPLRNKNKNKYT